MDATRDNVVDAAGVVGYCRRCGYSLVGLTSGKCPECGGAFDLADRRTFARRPPRVRLKWWAWRVSLALLLLTLAVGSVPAWYWWQWRAEQASLGEVRRLGGIVQLKRPDGTEMAVWLPERWGYWRDRGETVRLEQLSAEQMARVDLRPLRRLEVLELSYSEVTDEMLGQLRGMPDLRWVYLHGNPLNGSGLADLAGCRGLVILRLAETRLNDAGLAHVAPLTTLRYLDVRETAVTDVGMAHLAGLMALQDLHLSRTAVTDAGLMKLSGLKSLRRAYVGGTKVTPAGILAFQKWVPGAGFYE